MAQVHVATRSAGRATYGESVCLGSGVGKLWGIPPKLLRVPHQCGHAGFTVKVFAGSECMLYRQ